MIINEHKINNKKIAEVISQSVIISTTDDALTLMGDLYYQEFDAIILHEKNITAQFFDLKTGIAGEILQKFSNYRMQLSIVGDFRNIKSNSLKDFIYESNKSKQISFVDSIGEALKQIS